MPQKPGGKEGTRSPVRKRAFTTRTSTWRLYSARTLVPCVHRVVRLFGAGRSRLMLKDFIPKGGVSADRDASSGLDE